MADKRALKLIGIMYAALTLMVFMVAGRAVSSVNGDYLKSMDFRD